MKHRPVSQVLLDNHSTFDDLLAALQLLEALLNRSMKSVEILHAEDERKSPPDLGQSASVFSPDVT